MFYDSAQVFTWSIPVNCCSFCAGLLPHWWTRYCCCSPSTSHSLLQGELFLFRIRQQLTRQFSVHIYLRWSRFWLQLEFKRFVSRIFFLSDRNWVLALLSLLTAVYKSTWCGPQCSSGSQCSTVMSRTISEHCTWRQRKGSSRTTMWVSQWIIYKAYKFKVENFS